MNTARVSITSSAHDFSDSNRSVQRTYPTPMSDHHSLEPTTESYACLLLPHDVILDNGGSDAINDAMECPTHHAESSHYS